ncbi:hypothetical protein [Streptomyces sp. WL006]|uniref:hypothetical protein n=1 Tax=Streptomyces sp. WL006 TaxID=3423915 RepID=UPI003F6BBF33
MASSDFRLPHGPRGFAAGTVVLARRGLIPIEDIIEGDLVLTHQQRWMPVTSIVRASAPAVRVHCATMGGGLVTTADQAVRVRVANALLRDNGNAEDMASPGWVRVRDLANSHRIASPIDLGAPLPLPHASQGAARSVDFFRAAGGLIRTRRATTGSWPGLGEWLAENFGEHGAGRRFPAWALTMPDELRHALLAGIVDDAPDRRQFQTRGVSKPFMVGLRLLVCSLGFAGGLSEKDGAQWTLAWRRDGGRRIDSQGARWHSVTKAERGPDCEVFALAVAEDHSFIVDGFMAQAEALGQPATSTRNPSSEERERLVADQAPHSPAYALPDSDAIGAAVDDALSALHQAQDRIGRVMAVVTAAAVRDILTGDTPGAPFDATHVELMATEDGSLHATGRYWAADGTEALFTETLGATEGGNAVFDMNEWTPYLDRENEGIWRPLVTVLPERHGRPVYRLDLAKAAALPLD